MWRFGWFWLLLPLGCSAPVLALTLEIEVGSTTLKIIDNELQDQDPALGRIRYRGTLGELNNSMDTELEVQEQLTENGWELKVTTPQDGIANTGAPTKVILTIESSAVRLSNPVQFDVQYQGQWSDLSDGRQQINAQHTWEVIGNGTPLQQLQLDPVESLGKVIPFAQKTTFESPRALQTLTPSLKLQLGEGDALTITDLTLTAQSPTSVDPRWFYLAGAFGIFGGLSFWWLKPRRRRGR